MGITGTSVSNLLRAHRAALDVKRRVHRPDAITTSASTRASAGWSDRWARQASPNRDWPISVSGVSAASSPLSDSANWFGGDQKENRNVSSSEVVKVVETKHVYRSLGHRMCLWCVQVRVGKGVNCGIQSVTFHAFGLVSLLLCS